MNENKDEKTTQWFNEINRKNKKSSFFFLSNVNALSIGCEYSQTGKINFLLFFFILLNIFFKSDLCTFPDLIEGKITIDNKPGLGVDEINL